MQAKSNYAGWLPINSLGIAHFINLVRLQKRKNPGSIHNDSKSAFVVPFLLFTEAATLRKKMCTKTSWVLLAPPTQRCGTTQMPWFIQSMPII